MRQRSPSIVRERSKERRCRNWGQLVGADDFARPFLRQTRRHRLADGAQVAAHAQDGRQARFQMEVAGALGLGQSDKRAQVHGNSTRDTGSAGDIKSGRAAGYFSSSILVNVMVFLPSFSVTSPVATTLAGAWQMSLWKALATLLFLT